MRRVTRCDCWRAKVGDALMTAARIPRPLPAVRSRTVPGVQTTNSSRRSAHAQRLADAFPVVDRGLFLLGPPGVGKTHLAVAVLRQVIRTKGARGVFYDTRELLKLIRSTYDPSNRTEERDVLRPVMEAELLVLDDLGAERTTDWVDETLNLIVNTRYSERRITIFTSNYDLIPDETDPRSLLVPRGRPDAVAPARDVRLPARRRRRLPRDAAQSAPSKTCVMLWKTRPRPRTSRRSPQRRPAARPAPRTPRAKTARTRTRMGGTARRVRDRDEVTRDEGRKARATHRRTRRNWSSMLGSTSTSPFAVTSATTATSTAGCSTRT